MVLFYSWSAGVKNKNNMIHHFTSIINAKDNRLTDRLSISVGINCNCNLFIPCLFIPVETELGETERSNQDNLRPSSAELKPPAPPLNQSPHSWAQFVPALSPVCPSWARTFRKQHKSSEFRKKRQIWPDRPFTVFNDRLLKTFLLWESCVSHVYVRNIQISLH